MSEETLYKGSDGPRLDAGLSWEADTPPPSSLPVKGREQGYRYISLIRNRRPPRTTTGP